MGKASTMQVGKPLASIMPTSLDDVARLAKLAVMAGLVIVPKRRRKGDDEEDEQAAEASEENRLIAVATMTILHGMEVGLPPMQALQTITIINGRPLVWGDAVPALLWRAGFRLKEWVDGEGDARTAHCEIARPDGATIARAFSVADAKRARLWDAREKITRKGRGGSTYTVDNDAPWHRFPERMMAMRARGFAVKDGASDVTRGLYLREEYEENEIVDVTPKAVQIAAPSIDDIPDPAPQADKQPDTGAAQPADLLDIPEDSEADTPIADVDGYLAKLADDVKLCDSAEELAEIADANAGMIARLPKPAQRKARKLLEAAE